MDLVYNEMNNMKTNFIVSPNQKFWIEGAQKLFLAEPYVHHVMEVNGLLENYEEIKIAPYYRKTQEKLVKDHNFVDQKYHKYVPLLANRLNKIHDTSHDKVFWQKSFSLSLIRHIKYLYDIFQVCEECFDPEIHNCNILSKKSYHITEDFNEHRNFFQDTAFGQEQIFSIYINLFYPNCFNPVDDHFCWPVVPASREANRIYFFIKRVFNLTPTRLFAKLLSLVSRFRNPSVGIIESFFYPKHLISLILMSRGQINSIALKRYTNLNSKIQCDKREQLEEVGDDFDKFDRFFITSLKYCIPKLFIEDFEKVSSSYRQDFEQYKHLKYVVNESWIGNNYSSLAMAILQEQGVKHIYNEHNYLSHHFLCNNQKYLLPLVDKFVTLGWFNDSSPKLVKGSSLFEWVINKKYVKEHNLLYITGPPAVKSPEINAAYGDFGAFNATSQLKFRQTFFLNLKKSTIQSMVFRKYPLSFYEGCYLNPPMVGYDQDHVLNEYIQQCKIVDSKSPSAKILMKKSKLIIVDYLSTSYLESIIANIPTIFFWNKESYHLEKEYLDFYSSLVEVGICQTNPLDAAAFIEKIKVNPEQWWEQPSVQNAKNLFLSTNLGPTHILRDYLLNLAQTS